MRPGRDVFWDEAVADAPGELEPLAGRLGAPVPAHLHLGHDRRAEGRAARAGRLPRLDRARGRLPGRRAARRRDPLRHRHGLDHGPVGRWSAGWRSAATIVFAEGAPDWPAADRLWAPGRAGARLDPRALADAHAGADPARAELVERHDLSSLRMLVTTGEPWNPEPYRWLHEHVGGGRCPIINCSGGTEVGACFLSPTPAVPIKACSLGGPALGMAMDVVDAEGRLGARRGRRARLPEAVPRDDARVLARPGALPRHLLAAACPGSGCTATGPRSTRTATGSCTGAPTTRSTSPASGSGPRSSSPQSSRTRRLPRLRPSACRTR